MYNWNSSNPTLTNVVFIGNSASNNGGGVMNISNSNPMLINVVFFGNVSASGGGIFNSSSNPNLVNSILWGNTATAEAQSSNSSSAPAIYYSDIQGCAGSSNWNSVCGVDGGNNLDINPLFVDPDGVDNIIGSSDDNLRLKTISPLIDLGRNYRCPTVDMDDTPRPQDGDSDSFAICDIGAYEVLPPAFSDVPYLYSVSLGGVNYYLHDYIEALYDAGYTAGCLTSPLRYCPDNTMTRAESAVFLLRGQFGAGYAPPAAPWDRFADDWTSGPWAEKWAEGMWNSGLTAGCLTNPLRFCPWDQFPWEQAAVFGLKMKYGTSFVPDPALGMVFADMTDTGYWGTKWAEKAHADGLLPACGTSGGKPMFCPNDLVTRAWGAYLIVNAKGLPLSP